MGKRLGQHFLRDAHIRKKIVDSVCSENIKTLIEIGPGHGELTGLILNHPKGPKRIIIIEKDARLFTFLRKKFEGNGSIEVVHGNALSLLPEIINSIKGIYGIFGNIPYYITGHLFRVIEELKKRPDFLVFMVQKEVALRAVSLPPKMNMLSATLRLWGNPEILFFVPKGKFSPPPKVDSAVIRVGVEKGRGEKDPHYFSATRALFEQPRKTILNNLFVFLERNGIFLKKDEISKSLALIEINPKKRPQDISVSSIKKIAQMLYNLTQ